MQFALGQNTQTITATLHEDAMAINVQQNIVFHNQSTDTLNQLYLYDWNNAYSNKNTALAKRFAEEFNRSLHLAREEDRGNTKIISIIDETFKSLEWKRLAVDDIIKVQLKSPLYPGETYVLNAMYTVKLPSEQFTGYGYDEDGRIILENWYLAPVPFENGEWALYSNMNLNDMFLRNTNYQINFNYPESYKLTTNASKIEYSNTNGFTSAQIQYRDRKKVRLYFEKIKTFQTVQTDHFTFITNIVPKNLSEVSIYLSIDKVSEFLHDHIKNSENIQVMISEEDYRKNPIYGLNQLPSFLRPFQDDFLYELKILKTTLNNYLLEAVDADPRKDKWVFDAIETYLMMQFIEEYYPDMKMAGNFSKIWGLRSFHFSEMDFNEQYNMYYMLMARKNIDQPLSMQRDSLLKFNNNIANKYKAGIGLQYLNKYTEEPIADEIIPEFLAKQDADKAAFEELIIKKSDKNVDWFFDEYVGTRHKIDFKLKDVDATEDSIYFTIKNIRNTNVPISLFTLKNDSIQKTYWFTDIEDEKQFVIPNEGEDRLVLNYDKVIPEFNMRNNWKSLRGFLLNHKPLQFRLFQDAEDPHYNQIFFMPEFGYNYYDGIILGAKLYNKTLLNKPFQYSIRPQYATKSNTLVGGASFKYRQFREDSKLFLINYGIGGSYYHYAPGLAYKSLTPSISFTFRPDDFRSNERQILNLRAVNIHREKDTIVQLEDPSYTVFNARYLTYNNDILNYRSFFLDAQAASNFSKLSFNYEYRKLFDNNRQLNFRFFGGKFIHNNTNTNYFDFALDRPTDYLFDYNYLGRSESSGLYSQQLIIAEGGFKSKLPAQYQYSNDWILTSNFSTSIYRWIEAYGDLGLIKNKGIPTKFVYDSGIRLNLVTDYFELYLPVYSNNGWEIAQPEYASRIRFIITLSPRALTGLFTRKWF
ncbi:hypothetical protein SAMN05216480_106138 [Pustulibacterium marinum]|uniref:Peptidase M1 membrane alanine aminopeptidase domain-containing protein n=1 Tax=Pustulibacterium marinum TaxID=1224947 RepID=A0A1I7GZW2_9FLAO|nr:metalloprotease [Pustulibacterium marinum]SFU53952.1 hypothetical protein SAMN05216480_106138 [Pustulibacterium marinum]